MNKQRKCSFWALAILFVCLLGLTDCAERSVHHEQIVYSALPSLTFGGNQGGAASFAGWIDESLMVVGGCNFPHTPAADGGEKVFYRTIFQLTNPTSPSSSWQCVGEWPTEIAYGVSVTVPQGVLCIGGTDGQKSLNNVWLLHAEKQKGYAIDTLPALPIGLDNAAGALYADAIYVTGGQSNGIPSLRTFRLAWPDGTEWEELPAFPGMPRVQPVAIASDSGLYLMGGYAPPKDNSEGALHQDGCVFHAESNSWSKTEKFRFPDFSFYTLIGAIGALSVDRKYLIFTGGVNALCFLQAINRPLQLQQARNAHNDALIARLEKESADYLHHPVSWYRFNNELIAYDLSTGVWEKWAQLPQLARAGAALAVHYNRWYVVNGECKPGIRSCDVSLLEFPIKDEH